MPGPVERLPAVYARYLRLRDEGRAATEIAAALGVPVQSLDLLDAIARAKLASLVAEPTDSAAVVRRRRLHRRTGWARD